MGASQRIVFLQPRTYAEAYYRNGFGREQRWVPWFALFLAPIARSRGLSSELVDCRIDPKWQRSIEALNPGDLLAVSVITGHAIRDAIEASVIAQAAGAKVVWGGPHPSLFPTETLEEAPVDAVALGPGYVAMRSIAEAIASKVWPPGATTGLRTRTTTSEVMHFFGRAITPEPDFNLVQNWNEYLNPDIALASRTINYVASEGCARHCTFCSEPVISKKAWSPHDPARSIESIRQLCSLSNANGLKFHDANFFHDKDRALAFADRLGAELRLPWAATIHPADLLKFSRSELFRLAECGLSRVLVGLESPLQEITKLAGKQYDPTMATELASRLAEAGIRGMFTYIVGWPGAPATHYSETIAAAEQMREIWAGHQAKIHFLEPWPGTPIFRLLSRQGLTIPRGLNEWAEVDYYQDEYMSLHDPKQIEAIQIANSRLSPYVDA